MNKCISILLLTWGCLLALLGICSVKGFQPAAPLRPTPRSPRAGGWEGCALPPAPAPAPNNGHGGGGGGGAAPPPLRMGLRTWWRRQRERRTDRKSNRFKLKEIRQKGAELQELIADKNGSGQKKKKKMKRTPVDNLSDLKFVSGFRGLHRCEVRGDSFAALARNPRLPAHPVIDVLRRRRAAGTAPGEHGDGFKVGLAIEGGGMRGCVTAGMAACLSDLGLVDCFDAVYGSSAGSLVGAYIVGQQAGMPRYGCSLYYDLLTGRERHFIDTRYFLRTLGFGALWHPGGWRGLRRDGPAGKPVLKLEYLLTDVVQRIRPLDWESFWRRQQKQPLAIVASNVETQASVAMTSAAGHWDSLESMTSCMRASMNLPGIAGPPVTLERVAGGQPLVDSQLFEPIPYRSAAADGCTHVLVLRSRPDGLNVCGSRSLLERLIMKRYFRRKNDMPAMYAHMRALGHKEIYAEDVLVLNAAARAWEATAAAAAVGPATAAAAAASVVGGGGDYLSALGEGAQEDGAAAARPRAAKPLCVPSAGPEGGAAGAPHLLPISVAEGVPEIGRLERARENIFEGVRTGYAHAHELLKAVDLPAAATGGEYRVPDLEALAEGWAACKATFPDSILEVDCDPIVGCPSQKALEEAQFQP